MAPVASVHISAPGLGAILINLCSLCWGGGVTKVPRYLIKYRGICSLTAGCKPRGRMGQACPGCSLDIGLSLASAESNQSLTDPVISHQSSSTHPPLQSSRSSRA